MKKKITLLVFAVTGLFLLADFGYNVLYSFSSGPPAGHTGSPGDGANCTSCHTGTPTTQAGLITSNVPATGYVPGSTYTITASVSQAGVTKFGFQISPQSPTGTLLGTLTVTNSTETQLVGSGKYIEHKLAGTAATGNSKTWTFNWTAPASGTGNVTFYGAFNATNSSNSSAGDMIILSNTMVSEDINPIVVTPSVVDPGCNGGCDGSITITISGGVPPYVISWSSGQSGMTTITGLCDGVYSVTVADNSGRVHTENITVTEPPAMASTFNSNSASCGTCADGSITATVTGGTPPYSYAWSPGGSATATNGNIPAGTYQLIVTDNNNCVDTFTTTLSAQPLSVSAAATDAVCAGDSSGTLIASVSGGYPSYSYLWSPGSYTTAIVNNVPAGNYTLTVTDSLGNTSNSTAVVGEPAPITTTETITQVSCSSCSDGSAVISPAGGTPPYSITPLSNLPVGWHSYTVTDNNGCTYADSVEITFGVSVAEHDAPDFFNIYPNPASDFMIVEGNITQSEIRVSDLQGRTLIKQMVRSGDKIEIGTLPAGVYLVSIRNSTKILVRK